MDETSIQWIDGFFDCAPAGGFDQALCRLCKPAAELSHTNGVPRSGDAARLEAAVRLWDAAILAAWTSIKTELGDPNVANKGYGSMIKLLMAKRRAVLAQAFLSIALIGSFGFFTEAWAICSNKCLDGWEACSNWCDAHNYRLTSKIKCYNQCAAYWNSGKNPQSIGRSDPPNPSGPPRIATPVPPTTVGPPAREPRPVEPVKPVKPVGVSNPNKTGSGNGGVILLREHNDSGGPGHGH